MRLNLLIPLILSLALAASLAVADDGGVRGIGGSVELIHPEHSSVRMVRETVDAKLNLGNDPPHVRCVFVFKNEGKATTVKMGFPEVSGGELADPASRHTDLRGFKSWVDGKQVKTRLILSKKNRERSLFRAWHVKDVPFAAGQTRTVVDEYAGGMGGDSAGWENFNYTLITGASWKGKIGEAKITVDASPMLEKYTITSISPKGYTRRGGLIKWTLRNLEPKEDVEIIFVPAVKITLNGAEASPFLLYERRNGISMTFVNGLDDTLAVKAKTRLPKCVLSHGTHTLTVTVGSRIAVLDRTRKIVLPRAPFLAGHEVIVPLAAVVRALGGTARHHKDKGIYYLDVNLK
jgi:hypothetical protein